MKVCLPAKNTSGLETQVADHFSHASSLFIYDTYTARFETIDLTDEHACHIEIAVDILLTPNIGRGALARFQDQGIRVFECNSGATVNHEMTRFGRGELAELVRTKCCGNSHQHSEHHEDKGCCRITK